MSATKPVRLDGELVAAAEVVARRSHRSTTEQINHWTRIGKQFAMSTSVDQRRIAEVVAGREQAVGLTPAERAVADAEIDAAIEARAAVVSFGDLAGRGGVPTVSLDDEGRLVEIAADGTATFL